VGSFLALYWILPGSVIYGAHAAVVAVPKRTRDENLVDPPGKPPEWIVRIGERQQEKKRRRVVYEALRKHRIPYRVASTAADQFRRGVQANVPLRNAEAARTVASALQGLGLVAEVVEPQPVEQAGRAIDYQESKRKGDASECH
jgi:hypothetical protein